MNRNTAYIIKRVLSSLMSTFIYLGVDELQSKTYRANRERHSQRNQKEYRKIHRKYEQKHTKKERPYYISERFSQKEE